MSAYRVPSGNLLGAKWVPNKRLIGAHTAPRGWLMDG